MKSLEEQRAYFRKYYAEHKDKFAQRAKAWQAKNQTKVRAANLKYKQTHKEECSKRFKAYYAAHREEQKQRTLLYRLNHPETKQKWRAKNKSMLARKARQRDHAHPKQKRERNTVRKLITSGLLQEKLAYYGYKCAYCGTTSSLTWDHIKPIAKGGTSHLCNIVPACRSCNNIKHASWNGPTAWIKRRDYGVSHAAITPETAPGDQLSSGR